MDRLDEGVRQNNDPEERDQLRSEQMHELQKAMKMINMGWRSSELDDKLQKNHCIVTDKNYIISQQA
jgi:hypothetical protein